MTRIDRALEVSPEVAEALRYYVYVLRDPRNRKIFYVGKGIGGRIYSHVREAERTGRRAKLDRIRAIRASGRQVDHLIVRSGLATEKDALIVEQAVIDALSASGIPLTNVIKGHEASIHGLGTIDAAIARWSALRAPSFTAPTAIFIINTAWRPDMDDDEVFEATRGHWLVGARSRDAIEYAMGVAFGVVRGVYRVDGWYRSTQPGESKRWGFNGTDAPEMEQFVGTSVRHLVPTRGAQNPVRLYLDGARA